MACAFVDAAPAVHSAHKIKEVINPPSKWTRGERAPSNAIIELRIALPQPNFPELERHLTEVRSVISHSLMKSTYNSQLVVNTATRFMNVMGSTYPNKR